MELRLLLYYLRRWYWLLILGALLGAGAAYAANITRAPVYEATTQVMVVQSTESLASDLTNLTDIQMARTFRSLLTTKPVLAATSERIGAPVVAEQISSRIIEGTLLLDVIVQDGDPTRAALIANSLVDSLIEQNDVIQSSRFAASEDSLQAQIAQVEEQIAALRAQENQPSPLPDEELEVQIEELESTILEMNNQAIQLEAQISDLALIQNNDSLPLSQEQREQINEKQASIVVLELSLDEAMRLYQEMAPSAPEEQLQEQADEVIAFVNEINVLNDEITALAVTTSDQPLAGEDEGGGRLNQARAELALLRLNLDIANDRYSQLVRSLHSGSSGSDQTSQNSANLALYQQIYSSLLSNYEAVRLARLQSTPNIVQVDQATAPESPVNSNAVSNAVLGAVAGVIVMGAVALLIEYLDDTLKTPDDINNELGLPIVGIIADSSELSWNGVGKSAEKGPYLTSHPRSPLGEAFRSLRTNLEFASVDKPLTTLLITSPGPNEGKTTIAANLAAAFSQQRKRVVLLDCDLRRPKLHQIYQISNSSGLCDLLLGEVIPDEPPLIYSGSTAVIPSGTLPSNPVELLGSEKMTRFLELIGRWADVVIIDSPPGIVSDPVVLSAKVDGVAIVIQPGHTRADAAQALLEQLHRANARVVGVILNKIPRKHAGYYGRYQYNYNYHYSEDGQSLNGENPYNQNRSKNPFRGVIRFFGKQ